MATATTSPLTAATGARPSGRALPEAARHFVEQMVSLAGRSPGGVARLKRGAGKRLDDADLRGETATEFYRLIQSPMRPQEIDAAFLVASLFPLTKKHSGKAGNIGATLRSCRTDTNAPGLDRRVQALLDADEAQLPYRLRRAIHYAASLEPPAPVNWIQLLIDVAGWHWPDTRARIRRAWAEAYFIGGPGRQGSPGAGAPNNAASTAGAAGTAGDAGRVADAGHEDQE